MAYYGQRHGAVGSSSRPGNGFKGAPNSVEFLGREMLAMQLRDAKPDTDDERVGLYYSLIGQWLKLVSMFWSLHHHFQSNIHVQALSFPLCAVL
jgi:hypothetical protein